MPYRRLTDARRAEHCWLIASHTWAKLDLSRGIWLFGSEPYGLSPLPHSASRIRRGQALSPCTHCAACGSLQDKALYGGGDQWSAQPGAPPGARVGPRRSWAAEQRRPIADGCTLSFQEERTNDEGK